MSLAIPDRRVPRDFAQVIAGFSHQAVDVRDFGMGRAKDPEIAEYAKANQLCLLTEDWGFADIRDYPPADYHGLVVFETSDNSVEEKLLALRSLPYRAEIVAALPGRLAIVTSRRIRLRPPLAE